MVIAVEREVLPKTAPQAEVQEEVSLQQVEESFVDKARTLGVNLTPLKVTELDRLSPWIGRNEQFFRVSWQRQKSLSLFGLLHFSWTRTSSGIFRQHAASKVLLPPEAEKVAEKLRPLPEIEEMVVLEERRIDPILAVRVEGEWYEAYRWWEPPVLLRDGRPVPSSARGIRMSARM